MYPDVDTGEEGNEEWLGELCDGLSSNRSIECMTLRLNFYHPDDVDIFHVLAPFVKHNSNLRYLELYRVHPATLTSLSEALSKCNDDHPLERIRIVKAKCSKDDEAAVLLDSLKTKSPNLIEMYLFKIYIGREGCNAIAKMLKNPASKLQQLRMNYNGLTDRTIRILGRALISNNTLRSLDLMGNNAITWKGWQGFAVCLSNNPNSALEKIDVSWCELSDDGAIEIVHGLRGNYSVKELYMENNNDVRDGMWEALDQVLYDQTSIVDTFFSNHTLHRFVANDYYWYDDFDDDKAFRGNSVTSLEMNKHEDKAEVARRKILDCHFARWEKKRRNTNLQVIASMPKSVLVYAIEWAGRNDNRGYPLMFDVVQIMLFGFIPGRRNESEHDESGSSSDESEEVFEFSMEY